MTSTELAQREEPTSSSGAELVRNEQTDGWIPVLKPIVALANEISETEFVPAALRGNSPAVAACILFGREIDVAPMHALQNIHIIEGRPSVSAEQMRAMVLAAGHEIAFGETSGAKCEIKGRRKGSQVWTVVEWTAAMADAAQLLTKKNWIRYRGDMLIARASAKLCRMIFADVVRGMRTTEELEDDADGSATSMGASVQSGTTKVSRGGKSRARAAAPDVTTPSPAATARPVDIAPPGPPPAPAAEPVTKPDTTPVSEGDGSPDDVAATSDDDEYQRMLDEQNAAEAEFIERTAREMEAKMLARAQAAADAAGIQQAREHYGADILNEDGTLTAEAIKAGWRIARDQPGGLWDLVAPNTVQDSAPVAPAPKPMHATQTKAMQARFKGLGFTDEPDDREARLAVASTILGRGEDNQVETFRSGAGPEHMTYDEADTVMRVLAPCRSRGDVLALMVELAEDAAAEDTQTGPDGVEP